MMEKKSVNPPILIVEDSDDDFEATVRALNKGENFATPISRCEDGREALDYLYCRGKYNDPGKSPKPSIVLLDLNMPGMDGRDTLKAIRRDEKFRTLPVIVLTTSDNELDVEQCYRMGANTFVKKPVHLADFVEAISQLRDFWFKVAILPKEL